MAKVSAGLLVYRRRGGTLEVLLVHPGGPFWKKKDEGAWSVPKGEVAEGEDALAAARREFEEEVGAAPGGAGAAFVKLRDVKQRGGKVVRAWAVEGDVDVAEARCRTMVSVEWPPKSGKRMEFPEVDRVEWFEAGEAKSKINAAQVGLIEELSKMGAD